MSERQPNRWRPRLAWLALVAGVIAYDAFCPKGETLSEEVYRLREHKLGRFVVDYLIDSVAGHLKQELPPEEDWIHQLASLRPKHNQ